MLEKIQDWMTGKHRRRYKRRDRDMCVCVINGQTYPVENWSLGGLLIQADERMFPVGQDIYFTLKFKIGLKILEVRHKASIVRKSQTRVGLKFHPLTPSPTQKLRQVISENG